LSSFCFVFNVTPEISTLFNISLRIKSHQETNSPRTEKKRFLNSKKEIRMYWGAGNFFLCFSCFCIPYFNEFSFQKTLRKENEKYTDSSTQLLWTSSFTLSITKALFFLLNFCCTLKGWKRTPVWKLNPLQHFMSLQHEPLGGKTKEAYLPHTHKKISELWRKKLYHVISKNSNKKCGCLKVTYTHYQEWCWFLPICLIWWQVLKLFGPWKTNTTKNRNILQVWGEENYSNIVNSICASRCFCFSKKKKTFLPPLNYYLIVSKFYTLKNFLTQKPKILIL